MQLRNEKKDIVFHVVLLIALLSTLVVVSVYAYLGSFSRYLADDYCEAVGVITASPLQAALNRYSDGAFRSANRYSNILFVGFSELLGPNSIPITIVLMIFLWTIGLTWLVFEIRKFIGIQWSSLVDMFLGSTLAFMSFLQAPNLFQTVYWRSSMMTHFAPLVFGSLFFAFFMRQARRPVTERISPFIYVLIFVIAFILTGFSEPPAATLVTVFSLLFFYIWVWDKSMIHNRLLALVGVTFVSVLVGFLTLLFSPAVTNVAREKSPDIIFILFTSFKYAIDFAHDTFIRVPLPLLISFLSPFLLTWLLRQFRVKIIAETRRLLVLMIALPFLMWLLIAAGFSPSVFGQGFPVERMRFLAQTLMIVMLMLEGIWLGLLLSEFDLSHKIGVWIALALFIVIASIYPVRTAFNIAKNNAPEYRERTKFWDVRNEYIYRHISQGETDLFVPSFDGVYGVKELDSNPAHWINACAANFYHISSIQSFSTKNLMEALSE